VSNLKYHNLCTHLTPPLGLKSILGYDLKHCVQHKTPQTDAETILKRLDRDVRIRFRHGANQEDDNTAEDPFDTYDPKIYVKLKNWEPELCAQEIEEELADFRRQFTTLVASHTPTPTSNLSQRQEKLLEALKKAKQFVITPTDKNLGPAILERSQYIERCFQDHLLNKATYHRLNDPESKTLRYNARAHIILAVAHAEKRGQLNHAERTYFSRSIAEEPLRRPPQFYILPKVHKTPWKTRPVVSCAGSFNEIASKWLDYKLSKIVKLCPSHIKDSYQVLDDLRQLGTLPPSARLFTADAVSMYTNIDTDHGIETIQKWLDLHRQEILADHASFPFALVMELLRIVMKNNVFQFDDCWFHQQNGTAMGTSVACIYATIYYSYHEETKILPTYGSSLLYYKRFIDDVLAIWIPPPNSSPKSANAAWLQFKADLTFGILEWETEDLAQSVDFLDLTISITSDRKLRTRTFQKAMNLYLYLCPSSAHPPGVLKGLIFGSVRRFWLQNSDQRDYQQVIQDLYQHLCSRGHTSEKLDPLFHEAAAKVDSSQQLRTLQRVQPSIAKPAARARPLFFHLQYHPLEIPNSVIHDTFNRCCPRIREELQVDRIIIAHTRQPNLRDLLCKTQLHEPEGKRASNLLSKLDDSSN
jgi:hypothetical protein